MYPAVFPGERWQLMSNKVGIMLILSPISLILESGAQLFLLLFFVQTYTLQCTTKVDVKEEKERVKLGRGDGRWGWKKGNEGGEGEGNAEGGREKGGK